MKAKITFLLCLALCVILCSCGNIIAPENTTYPDNTESAATSVLQVSDTPSTDNADESSNIQTSLQTTKETDPSVSDAITTELPIVTDPPVTETDKPADTKPPAVEAPEGITPVYVSDRSPSEDGKVNLVMVGDILIHDPILKYAKTSDGYSFTNLFENIKSDIERADIAMLNQEVIIAGGEYGIQGYPRFNSPFELADAIADAGFDIACHATNHTLDKGEDAMRDCLKYWNTKYPHITVIGMQDSEADASRVCIVEKNDIKIAMLNYTYGLNGAADSALSKEPYLVDRLIEKEVKEDLAAAEKYADFTVVSVHWGNEYTHTPSSSQKKWANIFLDGGADLVLGTHPHVLQPVEWLCGDDGEKMLVYWSLGNFINSTESSGKGIGDRMLGALADITLERDTEGKVKIASAYAVPLITHIEFKQFGITTYKFSDYTEQMLSKSEVLNKDGSFSYTYAKEHFEDMFGEFLK